MMLTIRLTQIAFNYRDGNVDKSNKRDIFIPYEIKKLPSPLEFFAYVYYYGGIIMGPCYEFTDFTKFNNLTLFESCPNNKMPSPYFAAFTRFLAAILLLIFHFLYKAYFPTDYLFDPMFGKRNIFYKLFYSICCLQGVRFGYHFSFCLSEGANMLNGFGFNGIDENGNIKWDRLASANVTGVEFAQSPFEVSLNWNVTAGHWLKNYVYLRLDPPTSKPSNFSSTFTNLLSALWHGFYPGYFIHFGTASLVLQVGRGIRAKFRDRAILAGETAKMIYDFLGFLFIKFFMGYSMACFYGLTWEKCINYLISMRFVGHIGLIVVYLILMIIPSPSTKKPDSTTNSKKKD